MAINEDFHQGFTSSGDVGYLDELPRSSTGKIVRRVLQDRAGRA
jgi:acyl-coenzyme A synthetase/AMP-(fatty) acid ligase